MNELGQVAMQQSGAFAPCFGVSRQHPNPKLRSLDVLPVVCGDDEEIDGACGLYWNDKDGHVEQRGWVTYTLRPKESGVHISVTRHWIEYGREPNDLAKRAQRLADDSLAYCREQAAIGWRAMQASR